MQNAEERTVQRLVSEKEWMKYCGLGKDRARDLAAQIGIVRKFGARRLYDLKAADRYFDEIAGAKDCAAVVKPIGKG